MIPGILKYLTVFILGMIVVSMIILFLNPLWNHLVTYPRLEKEMAAFRKLRIEPPPFTRLNTYRGVMHVHSSLSHDSRGNLNDLIPAAEYNGISFIFLSDHPRSQYEQFPRGFKGSYNGVLIEPGSEKQGFVTWPPDSAMIDWTVDKETIADNIVSQGGIVFYAHTEEPHNWANTSFQGMEIYNIHTDTKDEWLPPLIFNFIVNGRKYRPWVMREMFDEQTSIMARWDSLNTHRKIIGFSAVDTHENQNLRARYLTGGRVQWIGPDANIIDTMEVRWWNRWLFSEPDKNGWIFKWMFDTYQTGFGYITNYVLADTLSVQSLAEHIKKGHLYTAFKSLGDAHGFLYYGINNNDSLCGIMGDSIQSARVKSLCAVSPLPGRFRLIHNGNLICVSSPKDYNFSWTGPVGKGAYRIEIQTYLQGKFVPWLYSNPIYVY